MAVSFANIDEATNVLTKTLVDRLSDPLPNIIQGREDDLLANDFKSLAILDMTIGEKYAKILLALSTHQESIAQAELELENKKREHRSFLVQAMNQLKDIENKYTAIHKSLNRGTNDWKSVGFIDAEMCSNDVKNKSDTIDTHEAGVNMKENRAPRTGATLLPSRPALNREFTEYTKALLGMGNAHTETKLLKENDQEKSRPQRVIVPVIHERFDHERTVEKSLIANNERPERIIRGMAASGSLDGSIMDHGPVLDETSGYLQPVEQPNFDDTDEEEDLISQRLKIPARPDFKSETVRSMYMETPSEKVLPDQLQTPLSSISLCRKPARPQFRSEIGRQLFDDDRNYENKREPEVKNTETAPIGFSSMLPRRPAPPPMKSEAARRLLGDL